MSPRLLPGASAHLVVTDSDEHTEDGHLTEDLGVRKAMVEKRLRKLEGLQARGRPARVRGERESRASPRLVGLDARVGAGGRRGDQGERRRRRHAPFRQYLRHKKNSSPDLKEIPGVTRKNGRRQTNQICWLARFLGNQHCTRNLENFLKYVIGKALQRFWLPTGQSLRL